jgi:hypothetical protein
MPIPERRLLMGLLSGYHPFEVVLQDLAFHILIGSPERLVMP